MVALNPTGKTSATRTDPPKPWPPSVSIMWCLPRNPALVGVNVTPDDVGALSAATVGSLAPSHADRRQLDFYAGRAAPRLPASTSSLPRGLHPDDLFSYDGKPPRGQRG